MIRRITVCVLAVMLLFSLNCNSVIACNEEQTNTYVAQVLFGDSALSKSSDEDLRMLMSALYLCSEQYGDQGQDKLDYLKSNRVSGVSTLSALRIKENDLLECSHNSWEHELPAIKKVQSKRRKLLQNTVNKVFDFGTYNNLFGSGSGKCNSFAALLYYSHILSDYLADDPSETEAYVNGKTVSSYSGQAYVSINGNRPSFTSEQKRNTNSFIRYSGLDESKRAGIVVANIGPDTLSSVGDRQSMVGIKPSGWNNKKYEGVVNSTPPYVYNRCHLLAHQLGGKEEETNLITGTRYLNESGMKPFEDAIAQYIKQTNNHVLYRVTPNFKRDNKLASGVQIEAYSVEDAGAGISLNIYCYNVQPGVDLNYENGENEISDKLHEEKNVLPFAVQNAGDMNPDLIFETNKHLEILFEEHKDSNTYTAMQNQITTIANEARAVGNHGETASQCYMNLKEYEYQYFEVLKSYVPVLLEKEAFFKSAFE